MCVHIKSTKYDGFVCTVINKIYLTILNVYEVVIIIVQNIIT